MQSIGDTERLRALAEQLVGAPLLVGALPPDLLLDLPLPPGAVLLGSVSYSPSQVSTRPIAMAANGTYEIVAQVPVAIVEVMAFYDAALPPLGWAEPKPVLPSSGVDYRELSLRHSGFITCHFVGPEQRSLIVRAGPHNGGIAQLRISIYPPTPGRDERQLPAFLRVQVSAPPDGRVLDRGGRGSGGDGVREWLVESPHDLETVAGQLARQLSERGWHRRDGGRDGPFVWSRWIVSDPISGEAWLLVMQTQRPQHYVAEVRMVATEPPDDGGMTHATNFLSFPPEPKPPDDAEDRSQ